MANSSHRIDRRSFLARTAATAGISVAGPLTALLSAGPSFPRRGRGPSPDYGPLVPAIDETTGLPLLMLPEDFRYLSFGWTRDPMNDGRLIEQVGAAWGFSPAERREAPNTSGQTRLNDATARLLAGDSAAAAEAETAQRELSRLQHESDVRC